MPLGFETLSYIFFLFLGCQLLVYFLSVCLDVREGMYVLFTECRVTAAGLRRKWMVNDRSWQINPGPLSGFFLVPIEKKGGSLEFYRLEKPFHLACLESKINSWYREKEGIGKRNQSVKWTLEWRHQIQGHEPYLKVLKAVKVRAACFFSSPYK